MPPLEHQDETLDPRGSVSARRAAEPARPSATILFHSDLRRIGDVFLFDDAPITLGRDVPAFTSSCGARPLADPCVSRRQLTVQWVPSRRRFRVEPDPSARRPLALFTASGEPCAARGDLEPGGLLAIGDRVLLRLGLESDDEGDGLGLIGRSASTRALRRAIRALADAPTVLVRGETGVGKELVALALHAASARALAPLVSVNCAALPENLVESELFGHARGAFSGASTAKEGLFRAAGGGAVFLDEIGELPLTVQAKLLRVLQERAVRPLGDAREIAFEARVICATHRDLAAEVEAGRFRADLYARIEAPEIEVPPLRDRVEDVPLLFAHFLQYETGSAASTRASLLREASTEPPPVPLEHVLQLMRHPWPRNVRELQRHVAAVVAASLEAGSFRAPPPKSARPSAPPREASSAPLAARAAPGERGRGRPDLAELLRVLDAHDYVQHQVARVLGVSRTTLDKWMRELGVRRPKDVPDAEIVEAFGASGGDLDAAARSLRVSSRGLRLRLGELGVPPPRDGA